MNKMIEMELYLTDLRGQVAAMNCLMLSALPQLSRSALVQVEKEWTDSVEANRGLFSNSQVTDDFIEAFDKHVGHINSALSVLKKQ